VVQHLSAIESYVAMFNRMSLTFSALLLGVLLHNRCLGREVADSIWLNSNIVSIDAAASAEFTRPSAMAVKAGKILAIGSDGGILRAYRGKGTEVEDMAGGFILPGFNDSHVHLAKGGFARLQVNLTGATSLEEMLHRIQLAARTATGGSWVVGFGWDHTLWSSKQLPKREDLDGITSGHPAYFERIDGHIAVVNTEALRLSGLLAKTPDPQGGKIDRDAAGSPTGILRESATQQIVTEIPAPNSAERRRALELSMADAISHGVTSVQDYSEWEDFLIMEEMERDGSLPMRVTEWLSFDEPVESLMRKQSLHRASDPMLHTGMLKGFIDGSLGSRTAALIDPYSDDPGNCGIARYDEAKLNEMTVERAKAGFQIGFHAIGDRAVNMALNAFDAAERAIPGRTPAEFRFRIEHDQVVSPQAFHRHSALGVIASMQPSHLLTDMRWAEERLGNHRARSSYAWNSMLSHNVILAFGTDYPVEPMTPFPGLYAAVTRRSEPIGVLENVSSYFPQERLTIRQAIYAYTEGAAYAEKAERSKGRLVTGYLADFVVIDRDLIRAQPGEILRARVLRTVVNGHTVYDSNRGLTAEISPRHSLQSRN
jgi:predicted amidohydrolase YtcJ